MKGLRGFGVGETLLVIWLLLWLLGGVGWCLNVYKLIVMCCEPTWWLLVRAAGVVVLPLGAITGFL